MAAGRAKKELSESEVAEGERCLSFFPLSASPHPQQESLVPGGGGGGWFTG